MDAVSIKTENISYLNSNSKEQMNTYRNTRNNTSKRQHQSPSQSRSQPFIQSCIYCGRSHAYGVCPARGKTCLKCNGQNHFANVCRSQQSRNTTRKHNHINNIITSDPQPDHSSSITFTTQSSPNILHTSTQQFDTIYDSSH